MSEETNLRPKNKLKECDLIMKGGVTSGVAYPKAIATLATHYRFRSIGGASAGAIGAALAAAAEHRRQSSAAKNKFAGFLHLNDLPKKLAQDMSTLFQPSKKLRPLFNVLVAATEWNQEKSKVGKILDALFRSYWVVALVWYVVSLAVLFLIEQISGWGGGWLIFVVAVFVSLIGVLWDIVVAATKHLPDNEFGFCSGISEDENQGPGITDWLTDQIDMVAWNGGCQPSTRPLIVGDLRKYDIELAAMTTDLSTRRPYQLPLKEKIYFFRESEFLKILPKRVVTYLKGYIYPQYKDQTPGDLFPLPHGDAMPVVLLARLSLSFPGLISAVPLYRFDYARANRGKPQLKKCVFSDGGISSNFPIDLFDALLPSRPTFGIALAEYDEARHIKGGVQQRAYLPSKPVTNSNIPIDEVHGIGGFLGAILNSAKDWQNSLQSILPGYAERIVEIRLNESEGGLNLNMPPPTSTEIANYGAQAGAEILVKFDMDEHKYRRAVSSLPELEKTLAKLGKNYDGAYKKVLLNHPATSYSGSDTWRVNPFEVFAEDLAEIGRGKRSAKKRSRIGLDSNGSKLPHTDAHIRMVASPNRSPKK